MTNAVAPASHAVAAPRVLGDFTLQEKIGEGGFGTVYLAEQRSLGRAAVIKVMRRSLATRADAIERFQLEARLASRLEHPYAAHIYAFGVEQDGLMWIAMERIRGTPLDQLLERSGPLPVERLIPLMERLCEAVQAAHEQGIVHRDIKPSNVMVLAQSGRLVPKLLDFGIAKLLSLDVERPRAPTLQPLRVPAHTPAELERTLDASTAQGGSHGSLTKDGQILGSPVYMAPEQWLDATRVGAWTDQYALALVAFEALTGRRAFEAETFSGLATQHLYQALPALPDHLPASLHAVLARAASKEPDKRFESVTAFAAALRAILGPAADTEDAIPGLPVAVRSAWMADAPTPIAESIAALVGARSPDRIADRVGAVASLLARWIGVVAIACRSRVGRLASTGSDELELVRELRRRPLRDHEWLDVAAALVGSFAERPAAWPVPEMVPFLAGGDALTALRGLVLDRDSIVHRPPSENLAELERALDGASWLLDYEVARSTPDGLELWMGQRGAEPPVKRTATSIAADQIQLLDADGAPIAVLSPLVVIAPPVAGEPDELFVFSGPARTGDRGTFRAYPGGYQRDDDRVWTWLAERVLDASPTSRIALDGDRCPYPGLTAFTTGDHESFVGRERDVEELINRLRTHAIVTVVGPSGIGKSSLLAAGLVPALPGGWHGEIVRPGRDPIAALTALIARIDAPAYRDGPVVTPTDARAIAQALIGAAERRATSLVVIVDQGEELFTMGADDARRTVFAEALAAAAAAGLRVVLAMRDDFLCRADELAAWHGHVTRSVHVLRVPGRDDLERMLVVPARRAGFDFDDPTLPREIVDQLVDHIGALPLLAFAAAELWERRDRHFRRLTRGAYEQIGGVTGALVQHADGVVDEMPAAERRLVQHAFRRLLTADGTRAAIGRTDLVAALGGSASATKVIDRLLAARLIVSRDDDGGERIEIVHETLVATWPKLAAWRREDAAVARLAERIATAARYWVERGRPTELLWRGPALEDLRRWRASDPTVTPDEEAFAAASEGAARRTRRRRFAAVIAAFATLAAGVVGLAWVNREIATQRADAIERLAAGFEERGRLAIADGDAARGTLFLAEASRLGARGHGFDILADHAASSLEAQDAIIGRDATPIFRATLATAGIVAIAPEGGVWWWAGGARKRLTDGAAAAVPATESVVAVVKRTGDVVGIGIDGRERWRWDGAHPNAPYAVRSATVSHATGLVASAGPSVRLWAGADGAPRGELPHDKPVIATAFDATGARLATSDEAGVVRIWDVAAASVIATCAPHGAWAHAIEFAPDGRWVATGGDDREVRMCDAASGATIRRFLGHKNEVTSVAVSKDGRLVASGSRDGTVRLWDATAGVEHAVLSGHRGAVDEIRFSPDATRLLSAGFDGSVRIWEVDGGTALGSLQGHAGPVVEAAWGSDGAKIVSASHDGSIRSWSVARAVRVTAVRAHDGGIYGLEQSADDRWAITAGGDRRAVVWDRATGRMAGVLDHDDEVKNAVFGSGGTILTLTRRGGTVRVWSWPGRALLATLPQPARYATFAPDGRIITANRDGTIGIWGGDGALVGSVPVGFAAIELAIDPASRWLVAASSGDQNHAVVIDLAARREVARLAADNAILRLAIDGSHVITAHDRSVRLWELGTWKPVATLTGHKTSVDTICPLPDGRLLTSAKRDGMMFVWSREGRLITSLSTEGSMIRRCRMSPDGTLFATASDDGVARVWDATTYKRLLALAGHRLPIRDVAFGRDGHSLLSAGSDGRLVTWDLRARTRTPAELAELVRCRVPLRLDGDVAMPRELDLDDPTCR